MFLITFGGEVFISRRLRESICMIISFLKIIIFIKSLSLAICTKMVEGYKKINSLYL